MTSSEWGRSSLRNWTCCLCCPSFQSHQGWKKGTRFFYKGKYQTPGVGGHTRQRSILELLLGCPYLDVEPKTLQLHPQCPQPSSLFPFKGIWSPEQRRRESVTSQSPSQSISLELTIRSYWHNEQRKRPSEKKVTEADKLPALPSPVMKKNEHFNNV